MEITVIIDIGEQKGLTVTVDEAKIIRGREATEEELKKILKTTANRMVETLMEGIEYKPK